MEPGRSGLPDVRCPSDIENRDTASCLFDILQHKDVYCLKKRYPLLILELLGIIRQGCSIELSQFL